MSNVEKIVNGIEEYAKDNFDEDILNHFSNAPVGVPSVTDLVNEDIEKFIKDANLEALFDVEDKDVQKKLLRKIMYFTYLQGLGNDERSFAIKGFMKNDWKQNVINSTSFGWCYFFFWRILCLNLNMMNAKCISLDYIKLLLINTTMAKYL